MPFIGQSPVTGAYHKLDSITTSATATYNLLLNGGAYYPASANNLLVSLNGVMQAPQDSFTVSGSQITFASALTSSDVIDFIMALGDVLNIGTPSDGTVNTSQLANSAVTTAKMASTLDLSGKTMTYGNLPAGNLTGTVAQAQLPVGSVLQVLNSTRATANSHNNNVYANIGIDANITPSSTSNKILILVNAWVGSDTQTANVYFELRRDTTTIQGDTVIRIPQEAQSVYRMYNLAFMYLDTPASTSTLAYSVRARTNAGTMYINRPGNQGGFPDVADSSITVIEVKG